MIFYPAKEEDLLVVSTDAGYRLANAAMIDDAGRVIDALIGRRIEEVTNREVYVVNLDVDRNAVWETLQYRRFESISEARNAIKKFY